MSDATEKPLKRGGPGRVENLTPWKPGQSGNPAGRPSKMQKWREKVEAEFDVWTDVYVRARESGDPETEMRATDKVMDRLYGKPSQTIAHAGAVGLDVVLFGDALPPEDVDVDVDELEGSS